MGTHFGARPKEIADEIAQRSDQSYTTYMKDGIKRYVFTYLSSGKFDTGRHKISCDVLVVAGGGGGGAYGGAYKPSYGQAGGGDGGAGKGSLPGAGSGPAAGGAGSAGSVINIKV